MKIQNQKYTSSENRVAQAVKEIHLENLLSCLFANTFTQMPYQASSSLKILWSIELDAMIHWWKWSIVLNECLNIGAIFILDNLVILYLSHFFVFNFTKVQVNASRLPTINIGTFSTFATIRYGSLVVITCPILSCAHPHISLQIVVIIIWW